MSVSAIVSAHAVTINLTGNAGPLAINGATYSETFSFGGAGSATLFLTLVGNNTVDGNNTFQDNFSISLNGMQVPLATFNLGGGGFDQVLAAPGGFSFTTTGPTGGQITGTGGVVTMSLPLAYVAGLNTLDFAYLPVGPANGGGQSIGDESWGYSGTVSSAAPEPATWAMMLIGFAGLGYAARRRKLAAV
jgi:hypothetical protein